MKAADIALAVLQRVGTITTMKMQKLVFYSQAVSLAETGKPLFEDDFQAWANGPVCPSLFALHRGMYAISANDMAALYPDAEQLSEGQSTIVQRVVDCLGSKTGNELSFRSHREAPWKDARGALKPYERCSAVISKDSIRNYYSAYPVLE